MSSSAAPSVSRAGAASAAAGRAVCRVKSVVPSASSSSAAAATPLASRNTSRGTGGVPAAAKRQHARIARRNRAVVVSAKDRDGTRNPHPPADPRARFLITPGSCEPATSHCAMPASGFDHHPPTTQSA